MLMSNVNIDSVQISWQGGIDANNSTEQGKTLDEALKYHLQMGEDQNYNLSGNVHSIISGNYGTGKMGLRSGNSHIINSCLKADTNGELDRLTIAYHFQIGLIGIIFILIKLPLLWMKYK